VHELARLSVYAILGKSTTPQAGGRGLKDVLREVIPSAWDQSGLPVLPLGEFSSRIHPRRMIRKGARWSAACCGRWPGVASGASWASCPATAVPVPGGWWLGRVDPGPRPVGRPGRPASYWRGRASALRLCLPG
jgi:hypothetical protein